MKTRSDEGNQLVKKIARHEMQFMTSESSEHMTWNYWHKRSTDSKQLSCPDDWDDTSVALAAFCLHDPQFLTGARLARIIKNLIASESQTGGPYFTWMVTPATRKKWDDIDMAVNANISYFLTLAGIKITGLENYFDKFITKNS